MCGTVNGSSGVETSCFAAFVDLNRHADRLETATGRCALPTTCRARLLVNVVGKMLILGSAFGMWGDLTKSYRMTGDEVEKTMGRSTEGSSNRRNMAGETRSRARLVRAGWRLFASLPSSLPTPSSDARSVMKQRM